MELWRSAFRVSFGLSAVSRSRAWATTWICFAFLVGHPDSQSVCGSPLTGLGLHLDLLSIPRGAPCLAPCRSDVFQHLVETRRELWQSAPGVHSVCLRFPARGPGPALELNTRSAFVGGARIPPLFSAVPLICLAFKVKLWPRQCARQRVFASPACPLPYQLFS